MAGMDEDDLNGKPGQEAADAVRPVSSSGGAGMSEAPRNVTGMDEDVHGDGDQVDTDAIVGESNALRALRSVLDTVMCDQLEANKYHAHRAAGVAEAIDHARAHTFLYTDIPGTEGVRVAEAAVLIELGSRLQLSENQLRNLAHTARTATQRLPWLWQAARDGFAPLPLVDATVSAILPLLAPADATEEEQREAAERLALVDELTSEWVLTLTAATFRSRLRTLIGRLDPRPADRRHADALADRRVLVQDAEDGMAWLTILMPRIDAIGAHRHLTSQAKHLQKDPTETRSRDQIRADLAADLLHSRTDEHGRVGAVGVKTGPVKTKVFVTIPIGVLTGESAGPDGKCALCGGSGFPEQARIVGDEPLDPLTAKQLFLDAKAFHRVIYDPIHSVVLDLERNSRRASRAQRDWLTLQHGTCARDGCTRLAIDAEIDHIIPWAKGGRTNLADLRPLCGLDHDVGRHKTLIRYRSRADGTVQITTPTGHRSDPPPPF